MGEHRVPHYAEKRQSLGQQMLERWAKIGWENATVGMNGLINRSNIAGAPRPTEPAPIARSVAYVEEAQRGSSEGEPFFLRFYFYFLCLFS